MYMYVYLVRACISIFIFRIYIYIYTYTYVRTRVIIPGQHTCIHVYMYIYIYTHTKIKGLKPGHVRLPIDLKRICGQGAWERRCGLARKWKWGESLQLTCIRHYILTNYTYKNSILIVDNYKSVIRKSDNIHNI